MNVNVQEAVRRNEELRYSREINLLKDDLPDQYTPYHLSKSDHENMRRFNKLGAARFSLQREMAAEKIMETLDKYTIVNIKRGSELGSKGFPVGKELWIEHKIYIDRKQFLLRVSFPLDCVPSSLIRTFDLPVLRVQVLSGENEVSSVTFKVTSSRQTAKLLLTSAISQAGGADGIVGKLPAYFEGVINTYLSHITPFTPCYPHTKE